MSFRGAKVGGEQFLPPDRPGRGLPERSASSPHSLYVSVHFIRFYIFMRIEVWGL